MSGQLHYSVFGLRVRSDLPLPQLFAAPAKLRLLTFRSGWRSCPIARTGPRAPTPTTAACCWSSMTSLAFKSATAVEILVEPAVDASDQNVRLYLLGSALGMLLHQRGLLPLHANCVEIDGQAFAFMGRPGAGKSTLAAWFHDRGYRLIADDVSVVGFDQQYERALVYPGVPRLQLWREALEASGRSSSDHPLTWEGDESYEKYDVAVSTDAAATRTEAAGRNLFARRGR